MNPSNFKMHSGSPLVAIIIIRVFINVKVPRYVIVEIYITFPAYLRSLQLETVLPEESFFAPYNIYEIVK
jgi:hypothetical protein